MKSNLVMCRSCDTVTVCQPFTVQEFERASHDEGQSDVNHPVTTGQCDACLENYGADEHCDALDAQDDRNLDRGEL
jgi:hypothetical protein